ncbi:MAG: transglutaminase family protein [Alphaproteobacteria bacterium]|nr:transglutaminase family protein [Alphaproteobacteria bacterium]
MQTSTQDPLVYLRQLGERGNAPCDIAMAALMLAALDHPDRSPLPYATHLAEIAAAARHELKLLYEVEDAARALARLMSVSFGYEGDRMTYDAPDNADLMSVIERRRGLPVTLGILYMHAARAAGLGADGLNAPGHFLMRITLKGQPVVIDPFNGGSVVERLSGPPGIAGTAVADSRAGQPVGDVDVLLRLLNNLKLTALKRADRSRALSIAERMALIAPWRPELWLDIAHLNEAKGSLGAAKKAYETVLRHAQPGAVLHNEAALALAVLKRRLN